MQQGVGVAVPQWVGLLLVRAVFSSSRVPVVVVMQC
jgi:hypothetical protein